MSMSFKLEGRVWGAGATEYRSRGLDTGEAPGRPAQGEHQVRPCGQAEPCGYTKGLVAPVG
jgi:hypothetical protein